MPRDRSLLVYNVASEGANWDLWGRVAGEEGPGSALVTGEGWDLYPALSPDDRYLAYAHQGEILVRAFPGMEGPWQAGPGTTPRWSPDGTRLYYLRGNDLMETRVLAGPALRFTAPQRLFTFESAPAQPFAWPTFDLTPDGEAFVMVRPLEPPPGLILVQNWLAALD
jgi:hypothetical protein